MATEEELEVAALMEQMDDAAAAAEAAATLTLEQEREAMEEIRSRAETYGVHPKSDGVHGCTGSMMRKFEVFLEKHGAHHGYDSAVGPTLELAERFVDYCASGAGRVYFSSVGRVGYCDAYFSNHLPCALAQKVFVMLKLPGWVGLRKAEAREKAAPFKEGLRACEYQPDDRTERPASLCVC